MNPKFFMSVRREKSPESSRVHLSACWSRYSTVVAISILLVSLSPAVRWDASTGTSGVRRGPGRSTKKATGDTLTAKGRILGVKWDCAKWILRLVACMRLIFCDAFVLLGER